MSYFWGFFVRGPGNQRLWFWTAHAKSIDRWLAGSGLTGVISDDEGEVGCRLAGNLSKAPYVTTFA